MKGDQAVEFTPPHSSGLWELGITELAGHNIETAGREEVNKMLDEGWTLLHIYTLKYREDGIWRERPMAILGRQKPKEESST
ncbi:MAG: hypothetical protein ACREGJ_00540 [Candidatus Saccharimonadales bacterium]